MAALRATLLVQMYPALCVPESPGGQTTWSKAGTETIKCGNVGGEGRASLWKKMYIIIFNSKYLPQRWKYHVEIFALILGVDFYIYFQIMYYLKYPWRWFNWGYKPFGAQKHLVYAWAREGASEWSWVNNGTQAPSWFVQIQFMTQVLPSDFFS